LVGLTLGTLSWVSSFVRSGYFGACKWWE
jgi:hypothetical protein